MQRQQQQATKELKIVEQLSAYGISLTASRCPSQNVLKARLQTSLVVVAVAVTAAAAAGSELLHALN